MLERDLLWFDDLVRAKRSVRVPVVLSEAEVRKLLEQRQVLVRDGKVRTIHRRDTAEGYEQN